MKNDKKGISAVVATVLIILITVAAVTIIWAAIIPMINDQLDRGTVCLDAMSQLTILNKGYTCFDDPANEVRVQVAAGAKDFDMAGVQVLIGDGLGGTVSVNNDTVINPNEEKMIIISYTASNATSVRVAPRVTVGNTVETCDALSAVDLKAC